MHGQGGDTHGDVGFFEVSRGTLATVEVERALFTVAGSARFFIHVRLTNTSNAPIGLSFEDYGHVVYPNQWGAHDSDHRDTIDEGRATFPPRGGPSDDALRASFRAGKTTKVEPKTSVDYYRDFNASTRSDVDAANAKHIIVSLGGELLVTDGTRVEGLEPKAPGEADFAVSSPVAWQAAPQGARVLQDRF